MRNVKYATFLLRTLLSLRTLVRINAYIIPLALLQLSKIMVGTPIENNQNKNSSSLPLSSSPLKSALNKFVGWVSPIKSNKEKRKENEVEKIKAEIAEMKLEQDGNQK